MADSTVGRVLWLAARDAPFRNAARANLGVAVAERGFILTNGEMSMLRDFWETLDRVPDRRAQEMIESYARLNYAPPVEEGEDDADEEMEAVEGGRFEAQRTRRARTRVASVRAQAAPAKVREQGRFLEPEAGNLTLAHAFTVNRAEWVLRRTLGGRGEVIRDTEGGAATATDDPGQVAQILLPWNPASDSGAQIDRLLEWLGSRSVRQRALCWSAMPFRPPDLDTLLEARGFVREGEPPLMGLDLRDLIADHECPGSLTVALVNHPLVEEAPELPYHSPNLARARYSAGRELPRAVWFYAAWLDRELVGHCTLNITMGAYGVAGLYDLGVIPALRGQGIGKALAIVAAIKARELGCHHLVFNATGERMYAAIGCRRIGAGAFWFRSV